MEKFNSRLADARCSLCGHDCSALITRLPCTSFMFCTPFDTIKHQKHKVRLVMIGIVVGMLLKLEGDVPAAHRSKMRSVIASICCQQSWHGSICLVFILYSSLSCDIL